MVVDRVLFNVNFVSELVPAFLLFSSSFSCFGTSLDITCPGVPQEMANGRRVMYLVRYIWLCTGNQEQ